MAKSAKPSPSKSPITGISPSRPQGTEKNCPPLGRMYQFPSDGRHTAKSVGPPTLAKTAGTGTSSGSPNGWMIGAAGFVLGTTYHVPSDGRQSAKSGTPSPSKSPLV